VAVVAPLGGEVGPGERRGDGEGRVVGREVELACGEAFLASAAERPAALVVEGEAGIGKTTVWRQVAARAEQLDFQVLAARPAEVETKLALSAVTDLLELVPSEAFEELPEPQRRALDIALLRTEPSGGALDPRTVATALRSLLGELSRARPLIVAIDDVHWLDPTSAAVLAFALRRLGDRPVGWLCTRRPAGAAVLPVDALLAPEALTRVTLGPLALDALHHVLKDHLDRPVSRAALVRLHEASGGNPFYALEIARSIGDRAPLEAGAPLPLPASLRALVAARIPTLEPDVRAALLAAAALSQPTVDLVERASSAAALVAAEETGLVSVDDAGRVAFAHPLYASAVYAAAATGRRRALHYRLAGLVSDPEERARHLAVAAPAPDEKVARALEDAAAAARSRGGWASAADLLEQARSLTPADRGDDAARRAIAAAEHHVRAGDRTRAGALAESVLEEALPRPLRADALRLCADISYHADNVGDAQRLYEEALACADDPRVVAVIELGLEYVEASRMDFASARAHAHRALELAERAGSRAVTAEALAHCAMMDFLCGCGVDWDMVERSLELEDPDPLQLVVRRPSTLAAFLLLYAGRHSEARERAHAVWAEARDRGDESDLAFVLLWLSWLETRCGDLEAAATLSDEAISIGTLTGTRSMRAWALTQHAYVHAHRGDVEESRRICAEAASPADRSGHLMPQLWIAASLTLLELSLGDPAAAWAACEPLVVALEARGIAEPVPCFFLPDALEALIALGALDRAERLIDAFEARGRALDRAWALATGARCRALLLAARGDLAAAAQALGRALVDHERIDMPFELARTLLVAGAIERRMRKRAQAKASFQQALAIFEDVGAQLWARRARAELDRIGMRRSTNGELTECERRVAALAAQGMTNREVAAALFISPKTVDANLGRVYRKLGIASRAQLGARMAATGKT
jgi:ATP/maltotriose-dependent transcriptional regulator MalT